MPNNKTFVLTTIALCVRSNAFEPNVCVNGAFVPLLSETNEIEINGLNENNVKSAKSSLNTETAFIIS